MMHSMLSTVIQVKGFTAEMDRVNGDKLFAGSILEELAPEKKARAKLLIEQISTYSADSLCQASKLDKKRSRDAAWDNFTGIEGLGEPLMSLIALLEFEGLPQQSTAHLESFEQIYNCAVHMIYQKKFGQAVKLLEISSEKCREVIEDS
uniref:Uncharacterized protein n=1 Tax=Ditylenchus dipsaci TaxID=166011 RepID=A0A915CZ04_9BILA